MTTFNTTITTAWVKVAEVTDNDFLITTESVVTLEVATTATDTAPTVKGHRISNEGAIVRSVIGGGYLWVKLVAGTVPAPITLIVSK